MSVAGNFFAASDGERRKRRRGKDMSDIEGRIYFDHAATTPLDEEVFEKMRPYYTEIFGNADSPHSFGREAVRGVDAARDKVAELIGAAPKEIYFTSGGTESDNWAIIGGAHAAKDGRDEGKSRGTERARGQEGARARERSAGRMRVLISSVEHHAALSAGERLKEEGYSVEYLPVNREGRVELRTLERALGPDVGLVAVMAANNETGTVQPVKELAAAAHANGSLFFTDAVQAAPYRKIDVSDWGADMLSFSAHKFYGPKGCGVLYVRSGVKIGKLVSGGEQERPSIVGLAAAYEKTVGTLEKNNAKISGFKELFLKKVFSEIDGVKLNGTAELPGIVNLCFEGIDNAAFLYNMDLHGAAVSAGSACAAASIKPSHVLLAMGLSEREARSSVRFSFGRDNTAEEILRGARLTKEIVDRLRGII